MGTVRNGVIGWYGSGADAALGYGEHAVDHFSALGSGLWALGGEVLADPIGTVEKHAVSTAVCLVNNGMGVGVGVRDTFSALGESDLSGAAAAYGYAAANAWEGAETVVASGSGARWAGGLARKGMKAASARAAGGGGGGQRFFRGARPGEAPNFTPRPNDFKVDKATGFVKDSHGVSVFDNAGSVSKKGFVPHEVNQSTIPSSLRVKQRGRDPSHYEITPAPGANLTPDQYIQACQGIGCLP